MTLKERLAQIDAAPKAPVAPATRVMTTRKGEPLAQVQERAQARATAAAPMVSKAELMALLNKADKRSKHSHYVRVEGVLTRVPGKPPADMVGAFKGRAGTKRRSTKGRVTTMPNGYVKHLYPWWDDDKVVMY